MLLVIMLTDGFDGHLLIVAVGDTILYGEVGNVLPAALLDNELQVLGCMETEEPAGRVSKAINNPGLKAVGIVDDWYYIIFLPQAFGIKLSLVLTFDWRD